MMSLVSVYTKKILVFFVLLGVFFASSVQAECNIHDHQCQFHSLGNQFFHVGNAAHHTKGMQLNPNIPTDLEEGLYAIGVWQDNSSGQKADLDIDVLLPSFTTDVNGVNRPAGAFIITDNAAQGGAPAASDPFASYADEHDRHVNTFQHQITFNNANATAIHSKDANGIAPIPTSTADKACTDTNNFGADSCEAVHIKGDIPTGVYSVGLTNFDVHNLSDPSTPNYDMWVYATPTTQGTLVSTGPENHLSGSMNQKGDTSATFSVYFQRWEQKPHAEMGVVYDLYANTALGKVSYSNTYKQKYDDLIYTLQDKTQQYVTTQYSDTITGDGVNRGTQNLGVINRQNVTNTNTVAVHRVVRTPPQPQVRPAQPSSVASGCGINMSCPDQSFPWADNKEETAKKWQAITDANSTRALFINNQSAEERVSNLVANGSSYTEARAKVAEQIGSDLSFANDAYNQGVISSDLVSSINNKFDSDISYVSNLKLYQKFNSDSEYVPKDQLNFLENSFYTVGDAAKNGQDDLFAVGNFLTFGQYEPAFNNAGNSGVEAARIINEEGVTISSVANATSEILVSTVVNPARITAGALGTSATLAIPVSRGSSFLNTGVTKPNVVNTKLKNLVEDLYKGLHTRSPGGTIGTGSTADAIRNEILTGVATGGRFHSEKGAQYINALNNWLRKNPNASISDKNAANRILKDLIDSLK